MGDKDAVLAEALRAKRKSSDSSWLESLRARRNVRSMFPYLRSGSTRRFARAPWFEKPTSCAILNGMFVGLNEHLETEITSAVAHHEGIDENLLTSPAQPLPALGELPFDAEVRDGWVCGGEGLGPLPSSHWSFLSEDPATPASKFFVVLHGNGTELLGYDMRKKPAVCYLLPSGAAPPEKVPSVWAEIDEWVSIQMEEHIRYSAR